jgi:uncharacterized protein with von Willebrand factor type A (vWA) domain
VSGLLPALVGLARRLRQEGLPVGTSELLLGLRAAALVGVQDRSRLRLALRSCWCHQRGDLAVFDRAFREELGGPHHAPSRLARPVAQVTVRAEAPGAATDPSQAWSEGQPRGIASVEERLRRLDFAACTSEELADLERAVAELAARPALRRSRRHRPARRGRELDWRRTSAAALRSGGEPLQLHRRRRGERPVPLLLICDVSGSMERYARLMVRFLHALERTSPGAEAFLFGTRLTRVTRELRQADPGAALRAVGAAVPDWSGGTRIGDCLQELLTRWGGRALSRGPVTILLSDGWETGDVSRLAQAAARLRRGSRLFIWCNPRMGDPDFRPEAAGMRAALPHLDRLQPVHNYASLVELSRVLRLDESGRRSRARRMGPSLA